MQIFTVSILVSLPKTSFCCEPRTRGDICSQVTGLELLVSITPSVSVIERDKKFYGSISQLYPFEIGIGILTESLGQHSGS